MANAIESIVRGCTLQNRKDSFNVHGQSGEAVIPDGVKSEYTHELWCVEGLVEVTPAQRCLVSIKIETWSV